MNLQRLRAYRDTLMVDMEEQAKHDHECFEKILRTLSPFLENGDLNGKHVLDIGCGHKYPLSVLFHNHGSVTVGIDLEYIGTSDTTLKMWWRSLALNGIEVTARNLLYLLLKKRTVYYKTLEQMSNISPLTTKVDIRHMSVEEMQFPDETFDLIVSLAVFEHVGDVAKAVNEVSRVMKRRGIAWINIHLFPSLSGGHHREWSHPKYYDSSGIPPWDQLRENRYPVHGGYLNRMREHEYLMLFRQKLDIIEVLDEGSGEGKALLTPDLRRELQGWTESELLKRGITIIARKRE